MQYIIDLSVKYSNLRLSTYIEHKKKSAQPEARTLQKFSAQKA